MADEEDPITLLLKKAQAGDTAARDELAACIYEELRRIARNRLRGGPQCRLCTTELVHEGYLRLMRQDRVDWQNRAHFFAIAATEMRRALVDEARHEMAMKRGGGVFHLELDEHAIPAPYRVSFSELISVDAALEALADSRPRQARVIELRAFAGLSVRETAHALATSETMVKREWSAAIDWLSDNLRPRVSEH